MRGEPVDQDRHPALSAILAEQLAAFPSHEGYLTRRFAEIDAVGVDRVESLAKLILRITEGRLAEVCRDYRWMAEAFLEEEIFFRREGRYRLSTFAEADAEVYSDRRLMTRYMNGVLLSQLWWRNHTDAMNWYQDAFLPLAPDNGDHLEIGPGHGLFLYLAAREPRLATVTGWDVSRASLDQVARTFEQLGGARTPTLVLGNLLDPSEQSFDTITFSEVLEHLEDPLAALQAIRRRLKPGGRVFVNAPVNSPAPDHITLFETPEQIVDLVGSAGLDVESSLFAPIAGATLDRARKHKLGISAAIIARKPLDSQKG